jgi:hypothetical protein
VQRVVADTAGLYRAMSPAMANIQSSPTMRRIVDLAAGMAMVVTDLHGDGEAYARYRDCFLELRAHGRADYLILTGDLLHRTPPDPDDSLAMMRDVLRLRDELGEQLIYLMGNHEFPHRYAFTLQRGDDLLTPGFEWAMGEHRPHIMALLDELPFYVRTKAGVALAHAGAPPDLTAEMGERLFDLSHTEVLAETAVSLPADFRPTLRRLLGRQAGRSYDQLIHDYFAVTDPDDPRYDDYLIGSVAVTAHPDLQLLWDALFTKNEQQYGRRYQRHVSTFLQTLSADWPYPQRALVCGHIDCAGGHTLVGRQQLRLASAKHAHPREAGRYLLFDVEQSVNSPAELLPKLASVFA